MIGAIHTPSLPDDVQRAMDLRAGQPDPQTVKIGGWVILHEPDLGRQVVCVVVSVRHLGSKP